MVDQVDRLLKDWALTVHPGIAVSFTPPAAQRPGRGVGLYLLEVLHTPPPSSNRRAAVKINLRYLITAWSDTPEDAHQILTVLAFAPLPNTDFELELEPVPLTLWTAFGLPPGPSFVIRVPLRQERPELPVTLVRQQLRIDSIPIVPFFGLVLGPDDIPLAEARVEIPSLNLTATADYKGRFSFPGVPAGGQKSLRVRARGRVLMVDCEGNFPDRTEPLVIHFSPLEK